MVNRIIPLPKYPHISCQTHLPTHISSHGQQDYSITKISTHQLSNTLTNPYLVSWSTGLFHYQNIHTSVVKHTYQPISRLMVNRIIPLPKYPHISCQTHLPTNISSHGQ